MYWAGAHSSDMWLLWSILRCSNMNLQQECSKTVLVEYFSCLKKTNKQNELGNKMIQNQTHVDNWVLAYWTLCAMSESDCYILTSLSITWIVYVALAAALAIVKHLQSFYLQKQAKLNSAQIQPSTKINSQKYFYTKQETMIKRT